MIILNRIRIVEYNNYHYEVLPSWIYVLSSVADPEKLEVFADFDDFGKSIISFWNTHLKLRSIFLFSSEKKWIRKVLRYPFKLLVRILTRITGYPDMNDNLYIRSFSKKRIIVFNSIEPLKVLEKAKYFMKNKFTLLVILHNGDLICNKEYKEFLRAENVKVFALTEMVRDYLVRAGLKKTKLMAPVYFNNKNNENTNSIITFVVQGNVNFSRRNYTSLINAVEELAKTDDPDNFLIKILGNSNTNEGNIIKSEIKQKKIEKYFVFYEEKLDYQKFYEEIQVSDYLLVLQDTTSHVYSPYFETKCSAVINVSLGFSKIMIMHKEQSRLNRLEEMSILYEDDGLKNAMLYAIKMSKKNRMKMEAMLSERREILLERSVKDVEEVLSQI